VPNVTQGGLRTGFHVSESTLVSGTILEPRFRGKVQEGIALVSAALSKGEGQLQSLLLADWLFAVRTSGRRWLQTPLIETVFDAVRTDSFPGRPSRLESVFLFPDANLAADFMKMYKRGLGFIYECSIESDKVWVGDMEIINRGVDLQKPIEDELQAMQQRAALYWKGASIDSMDIPEILVLGTVTIGKQCPT
jgi:hypothetical protein